MPSFEQNGSYIGLCLGRQLGVHAAGGPWCGLPWLCELGVHGVACPDCVSWGSMVWPALTV